MRTGAKACGAGQLGLELAQSGIVQCGRPANSKPRINLKPKRPHFAWLVCRGCLRGGFTLALWALWLALAVLLLMQARIATSDEITIPDAVLRNVERRMAERGLRFTFGAINCDSGGRVVVRDLKLFSSQHPDPVLAAQAVRFEINPYALWMRNIAPRKAARIDGASLRMPAMFSSDGTNAAIVDDINAEVEIKAGMLYINGLTARIGNLAVLCRGALAIPETRGGKRRGADMMPGLVAAYLKAARQADSWTARLESLDSPMLDITLTPEAGRIALARIDLTAGSLRMQRGSGKDGSAGAPPPTDIALGPLLASTTLELGSLFSGDTAAREPRVPAPPIRIQISTTDALLANSVRARNARLALAVPLADALRVGGKNEAPAGAAATDGPPPVNFSLTATADLLAARNITGRSLTARARGQFPKKLIAEASGRVFGEPVSFETEADLDEKKAESAIATRVTPGHIEALSRELKYDIGAILKPARPIEVNARAQLEPGWRFAGATGSLDIGAINADNVPVDRARGRFAYNHETREIIFSPALAFVGDSFARGSFEMNFSTLDYRFLLAGRLRPRAIDGWLGKWWPAFWDDFTFDGEAAFGDVDVQGNFKHGDNTRVFIFADAERMSYNNVAFDRVLLTLFARPDHFDALDLFARRGDGFARGTFTYQRLDPGNRPLLTVLDFKAENIDPVAVAPAISPKVAEGLAELRFEKPLARLRVAGRIDGPASPNGEHVLLNITAEGDGPFTYDRIPFTSISTALGVRDDVLDVERLDTQFAGGHLAVKAQLSGTGDARQLGFDLSLNGADFGRTLQLIEEISAHKRGVEPPPGKPHQQPAGAQLDLRFSADGLLRDNLSFTGNGSAEITGAELVNVNLFGSLSQALRDVKVLNFTTLSLSNGQVNFTLDRRRVIIPEAILTGEKAQVKLNGDYMIDTRFANLTAKVYPLSESKGIIGKGFGFLLVPITHLTELKLTGLIDAPRWRFSYGPTSFFRALAGKGSDTESLEQEHSSRDAMKENETPPQVAHEKAAADNVPLSLRRPAAGGN